MKKITYMPSRQKGLTLIEMMVAMAISLVIVIAAAYVYLGSRESQRAIDRSSNSQETGAFVLQMIGREVMNAGFYPAIVAPIPVDSTQQGMYDTYLPCLPLQESRLIGRILIIIGRPLHFDLPFMAVQAESLMWLPAPAQL